MSSGIIPAETTDRHTLGSLSPSPSHASTTEATASEDEYRPNTDNGRKNTRGFWKRLIPRRLKGKKRSESKDDCYKVQTVADQERLTGKTVTKNQSRQPITTIPPSGATGEPLRRSQLPIPELQSPEVQQGREASRHDARILQERTGMWTHIKWAHHDKETFKENVRDIRKTINTLDKLLALRSTSDSGRLLPAQPDASSVSHSTPQVQGALERLHKSLRNLNVHKHGQGPGNFAVHIAAPFNDNWRLVHDQYSLPLRKSALMFYVQQRKANEENSFLLIETLTEAAGDVRAQDESVKKIEDLDNPSETANGNKADAYSTWGFICTPEHAEDEHRIFVDTATWRQTSTLADLLADPESLEHFSPENVFILTRRIMVAHLDFSLVRASCPNPRLESYAYYKRSLEVEGMQEEGPPLLRPYLASGFGCRPPGRQPGATSGPSKDTNAPVIELGLVLFQIGSRRKLDYRTKGMGSTVELLSSVKNDALGSLWEVEKICGPLFSRVIETFLLSDPGNETKNVENGLSKLIDCQNALTAPIKVDGVQ